MQIRAQLLLATGLILGAAAPVLSQGPDEFPLERGDSFERIEEVLGNKGELEDAPRGARYTYAYRVREEGIWLFLDDDKEIQSLRFNAPFDGTVRGVRIGDTLEEVEELLGEADITRDGMVDSEEFQRREEKKRAMLDELPDMVPKARVLELFEEMRGIDRAPPTRLEAHIYRFRDGTLSVQVHPDDETVTILLN